MRKPVEPLTGKRLAGRVWIAAGARDGDRRFSMAEALRLLAAGGVEIVRLSSLYETEPVDLTGGRTLLNGAFEVTAGLQPRDLLAACLAVEQKLGRRRDMGPAGQRPIDLDILMYESRVIDEPGLTIPHPRMHERLFVLAPLAEIAPEAWHPVIGKSVADLLDKCARTAWVKPFAPPEGWRR